MKAVAALAFAVGASAVQLTLDNYEEKTAGKTVFISYYMPENKYCKDFMPMWDQLMAKYTGSDTILVEKVNCTDEEVVPLCGMAGLRNFPTVLFGNPYNPHYYPGSITQATVEELSDFASKLKPVCSPWHLDACSAEAKDAINGYQALPLKDLEAKIAEGDKKVADFKNQTIELIIQDQKKVAEERTQASEQSAELLQSKGLHMLLLARHNKTATK